MQNDLDSNYPSLNVEIIGINEVGADPAGFITDGRNLPWLLESDSNGNGLGDIRDDSWQVDYRDVVVVDENGDMTDRYNLTTNSLQSSSNYNTLKQMFIDAGVTPPESNWQSPVERLDVNADGLIAPLDALLVINEIGKHPGGMLPSSLAGSAPYVDPSGDGLVTPLDALAVINQLNFISSLNGSSSALSSSAGGAAGNTASAALSAESESLSPESSVVSQDIGVFDGFADNQQDANDADGVNSVIADAIFADLG